MGFEPTLRNAEAAFRERYHEPLGHLSRCQMKLYAVVIIPVGHDSVKACGQFLRKDAPGVVRIDSGTVYFVPGFRTRPTKRMLPVPMSRIRKMNGRSMVTCTGGSTGADVTPTITAVAAAASVPASSTETNAL